MESSTLFPNQTTWVNEDFNLYRDLVTGFKIEWVPGTVPFVYGVQEGSRFRGLTPEEVAFAKSRGYRIRLDLDIIVPKMTSTHEDIAEIRRCSINHQIAHVELLLYSAKYEAKWLREDLDRMKPYPQRDLEQEEKEANASLDDYQRQVALMDTIEVMVDEALPPPKVIRLPIRACIKWTLFLMMIFLLGAVIKVAGQRFDPAWDDSFDEEEFDF
jgi:hypothetical protein